MAAAKCTVCGTAYEPSQYTGGFHCAGHPGRWRRIPGDLVRKAELDAVKAENRKLKRLLRAVLKAAKECE